MYENFANQKYLQQHLNKHFGGLKSIMETVLYN